MMRQTTGTWHRKGRSLCKSCHAYLASRDSCRLHLVLNLLQDEEVILLLAIDRQLVIAHLQRDNKHSQQAR